jgi:hypothetical protein
MRSRSNVVQEHRQRIREWPETHRLNVRGEKLLLFQRAPAEVARVLRMSYFGAESTQGPVEPGCDALHGASGIRVQ